MYNEQPSGLCVDEIVDYTRENVNLYKKRTVTSLGNRCISSPHVIVDDAIREDQSVSKTSRSTSLVLLIAYVIFLICGAVQSHTGETGAMSVWQLQESSRLLEFIGSLALAGIYQFVYFVPVGFFCSMVLPRGHTRSRRLAVGITALIVAILLTISVYAIAYRRSLYPSEIVGLSIALCGCSFGTWVGRVWLGGWKARLWLLPKIALLTLFIVLFCGVILSLLVDRVPLSFEPPHVTSADKRELVQIARSQHPRSVREGQTQTLQLTQRQINLLLAWGLSLNSEDRKAKVDLINNRTSIQSSFGIPFKKDKSYHLNLKATGSPEFRNGDINLNIDQCQIGTIGIPKRLLDIFSPAISSLINQDPLSRPFLEATRNLRIEEDLVEVTYSRLNLPPGFQETVFGPSAVSQEVLAATRAQVKYLLSTVNQLNDTPISFSFYMEKAFSLARDRSIDGNAIIENRGAVFALGILLGHPRIEEFLGPILSDDEKRDSRWLLRSVLLRGRSDWTRHFLVSAAIALLSDESVSNAAGLLKEELDADAGGSGFSFADLLADRAGTTFAILATCDKESACNFQDRISGGFNIDDFFPPASDLPEGISDTEFQTKYGGVGGQMYNQFIDEIEKRIASCAAYR